MLRTVLADEVELQAAVGVGPEPTLGAVKPGAVVVAAGKVPEGDGHRVSGHPLPVLRVVPVPHGPEPVLPVGVALVTPPKLPGEESLQSRIGLVHEGAAARVAELEGALEVGRLLVVEDVALAVVGSSAARRLVPECWATLDW